MQHCQHCFTLNPMQAEICRSCHRAMVHPGAQALTMRAEAPMDNMTQWYPETQQASRGSSSSWATGQLSGTVVFIVAIALLVPALFLLSPGWVVGEQPVRASMSLGDRLASERQAQIQQAVVALRAQMAGLDSHLAQREGLTADARGRWSAQWRGQLQAIKDQYHIWGTVDAHHPDARAEDALRNAMLYLYSLEHAALKGAPSSTRQEYAKLKTSFEKSLVDASRG